jgi:dienelactone hydrolase
VSTTVTKRIYVCHPFADDPVGNAERVRVICRTLVAEGHLPIAPQLYFPAFIDETTERELALRLCVELVACCEALWFYGTRITPGMEREISAAHERGIPVVNRLFPSSTESTS